MAICLDGSAATVGFVIGENGWGVSRAPPVGDSLSSRTNSGKSATAFCSAGSSWDGLRVRSLASPTGQHLIRSRCKFLFTSEHIWAGIAKYRRKRAKTNEEETGARQASADRGCTSRPNTEGRKQIS